MKNRIIKRVILLLFVTAIIISCGGGGDVTSKSSQVYLYAWGYNGGGNLDVSSNVPAIISTNKVWKQASGGVSHIAAIDDANHLYVWGDNTYNQLGTGDDIASAVPVRVEGTKTWKQVSAGWYHTVAIDSGGALYAWGLNGQGQLGNGESGMGEKSTTPVKIGDKTWSQVHGSYTHTVAIDSAGKLYAWGGNGNGQLGIGPIIVIGNETTVDKDEPTEVVIATETTKTWEQVSVGYSYSVAIDSDGALYAWGSNSYGQLGAGKDISLIGIFTPTRIGNKTWKQVSAGVSHTVAIDSAGVLYVWGKNDVGQLGIGTETVNKNEELVDKNVPTAVVIGTDTTKTWNQVSVGENYTVALDGDGALYAWGENGKGQLGIGTEIVNGKEELVNKSSPIRVGTDQWVFAVTGKNFTLAFSNR